MAQHRLRIDPLPDGHHVLLIGNDGRLFSVDLDTKAIVDLGSKNNDEWIAAP